MKDDLVTAEFEDGTRESGHMLIGCDGSHSRVREFLVGHEAAQLEDTGHTMINHAATHYSPEQAHLLRTVHPILKLAWHPELPGGSLLAGTYCHAPASPEPLLTHPSRTALHLPDPNDPTNWAFQCYTSWNGPPTAFDLRDPTTRMAFVRERLSHFCEPFRTAFLALPKDEIMSVYPAQQWAPTMKWDNHGGKVTLAGDAAHSMLPRAFSRFPLRLLLLHTYMHLFLRKLTATC